MSEPEYTPLVMLKDAPELAALREEGLKDITDTNASCTVRRAIVSCARSLVAWGSSYDSH